MTLNRASTYPRLGLKKNCTPRAACSSVSALASVGEAVSVAVDVNVRVFGSMAIVLVMALPEAARSGVT